MSFANQQIMFFPIAVVIFAVVVAFIAYFYFEHRRTRSIARRTKKGLEKKNYESN